MRLSPVTHKLASFSFNNTNPHPTTGPLLDLARKTLYATANGYPSTYGFIFQLTPSGQETTVYNFCSQSNCADGYEPSSSPIKDSAGSLYGTTKYGGNSATCGASGCGVVYEITP